MNTNQHLARIEERLVAADKRMDGLVQAWAQFDRKLNFILKGQQALLYIFTDLVQAGKDDDKLRELAAGVRERTAELQKAIDEAQTTEA